MRTLEQAFNARFHNSQTYAEFCSLKVADEIEELDTGSKNILKTSDKLKEYLRFIDKVMLDSLQKNEQVAHAYVKEKSTLTAVQAHIGNKYFFTTDIENFFPSIMAEDVERILKRDTDYIPILDFKSFIPKITELTTYRGSITVGFATSPKLSNSFLLDFDTALNNYCKKYTLIYTRYSDDIIISCKSRNLLNNIADHVQELLHEFASPKILLSKKKTRQTHIGKRVKILGIVILPNGRITIDSKYKKTIESLLHYYINDEEKFQKTLTKKTTSKEQSLFGLLHYANSIDPLYIEKLQRKYGAYTLGTLMDNK